MAIVIFIHWRWSLNVTTALYATVRMFLQLTLVGFFLIFIFKQANAVMISGILVIMILVAAWIAVRPLKERRLIEYPKALIAFSIGCPVTLALMIKGVINLHPWYDPKYIIPLAGMVFSQAMNCLSLAAERFHSDMAVGQKASAAKGIALKTALIPITNAFFAVGLVSIPGMMTGQILAGISPLVAVRYQMMILAMLYGAGGITAAVYLSLQKVRPS